MQIDFIRELDSCADCGHFGPIEGPPSDARMGGILDKAASLDICEGFL